MRVLRACRDLGITGVAVYSEPDATALHARYADEAYCIGRAPVAESYLSVEKIIDVAKECGAEAIHPGYGFLSEQSAFARACIEAGIVFIGPPPDALEMLGDKVMARTIAERAGAPTVPGSGGRVEMDEAREVAARIGYPLLIKAAAGGGGKGIRLVESEETLDDSLRVASAEAAANFGDGGLYLERFVNPARHIEVQILADNHGNVVHLGERECSIQRRSQKLVEESPSVAVDAATRRRIGEAACAIARESGYQNAGTVEFLMDATGDFYFIEANARLQVEHPVTELVTGLDLVHQQLRVASGEPLGFTQDDVHLRGWAIECRITAEDADAGFLPSLGHIALVSEPSGPGVRVDSSLFTGIEVSPYYDSLLSKLIVWGSDREEALRRMRRALSEYQVLGVKTTLPFHRALMQDAGFISGRIDTHYLDDWQMPSTATEAQGDTALLVAALLSHQRQRAGGGASPSSSTARSGWRSQARQSAVERNGGDAWRNTV